MSPCWTDLQDGAPKKWAIARNAENGCWGFGVNASSRMHGRSPFILGVRDHLRNFVNYKKLLI